MRTSTRAALTAFAIVVLAAAVLVPVAGANGMMGTPSPSPSMTGTPSPTPPSSMMPTPTPSSSPTATPGGWCGGGMWSGSGAWGGTGMWGMGSGMAWLTGDPAALAAWTQLRADHQKAMQAWYDTYKADLKTTEAQQALHDLWTRNWNDMKAFYEQYSGGAAWTAPASGMWGGWDMGGMMGQHSWDVSRMWGTGYGASWMMGHGSGFGQWLAMRGKQTAAVGAWARRYAGDPTGTAAHTAMHTLKTRMHTQVRGFYRSHHLAATTTRMRLGAGGWMGLGGIWGGWGW
jgi:hypothetical protein